ncbi:MAG: hypothetical protein LQ350_002571 [Teloschistes chrysophthalmus]|nr:MAG: hypothetical protein LQ350_002571 [Niorma chrysophthalma]
MGDYRRTPSEERPSNDEERLLKQESLDDDLNRKHRRAPWPIPIELTLGLEELAPLNEALIPEKKMVHGTFGSKNPFKGAPSPELDHAWHQLFVNANVRVSSDDLKKINRTSVRIGDETGGYFAMPGKSTADPKALSRLLTARTRQTFIISCIVL